MMEYTNENRGYIQNKERAKQLIEFTGMKYGNATPTDIDGFIERYNEAFVFFEIKHRCVNEVPTGQRMALTRLVDNLAIAGKKAVLFVAKHDIEDAGEDVIAADTEVTDIYYNGIWHKYAGKTLKQMTDRFMRWAVPFN